MSDIYIVEDDVNIREIARYALKSSGFSVKEFRCGKDFYQAVAKKVPSLVILDTMLPDEDGQDILTNLRKMHCTSKVPVILVVSKTAGGDKIRGLDMGADDCVTKPLAVMELISRVKALLRQTEDMVLTCGDIILDVKCHTVKVEDGFCELTFKEFELLKYLMMNEGSVLSRDKIMNQVWEFEYEGESRTVDMHIKTLRQKLGSSGSVIKTVRGVGYLIG